MFERMRESRHQSWGWKGAPSIAFEAVRSSRWSRLGSRRYVSSSEVSCRGRGIQSIFQTVPRRGEYFQTLALVARSVNHSAPQHKIRFSFARSSLLFLPTQNHFPSFSTSIYPGLCRLISTISECSRPSDNHPNSRSSLLTWRLQK